MRWQKPRIPAVGDYRVRRRWAWVPTVTSDDVIVWMEHVYYEEEATQDAPPQPYWTIKRIMSRANPLALAQNGSSRTLV